MKKRLEDDLREELRSLERRVAAIRTLLGEEQLELRFEAPIVSPQIPDDRARMSSGYQADHVAQLRRSTLRQAVEYALRQNPEPMAPAEIRSWLESNGFALKGKTKLAVRVRGEIHGMVSDGILPRANSEGKYRLANG